jgi:hypothetical protein
MPRRGENHKSGFELLVVFAAHWQSSNLASEEIVPPLLQPRIFSRDRISVNEHVERNSTVDSDGVNRYRGQ